MPVHSARQASVVAVTFTHVASISSLPGLRESNSTPLEIAPGGDGGGGGGDGGYGGGGDGGGGAGAGDPTTTSNESCGARRAAMPVVVDGSAVCCHTSRTVHPPAHEPRPTTCITAGVHVVARVHTMRYSQRRVINIYQKLEEESH